MASSVSKVSDTSQVASHVSGSRYVAPDYADWQSAAADAVCDVGELCRVLRLDPSLASVSEVGVSEVAAGEFPLCVPRTFLERIRLGDPEDPLLLQILPTAAELVRSPGFCCDPLEESKVCSAPGLLQKYQGRSLMVTTGACCVHCRFCFRRHFPYASVADSPLDWGPRVRRIAEDSSVREVVLSGGDPLSLDDKQLAQLAHSLESIDHLRRLRIHTRFPIMIPQRVTPELIALLRGCRLRGIVVVHVNHPREIDAHVASGMSRLVDGGLVVLSQSVLLRRVNDDAGVLAALFEHLADLGVVPYYLHQLDRVAGASHFEVPVDRGIALMQSLRSRLPGYAVPRYVRDTPSGSHKEVLA